MPYDGTYLSRTAYADLFNVLGTRYGVGDGINTFNLPDLRGLFVRGLDEGKGIDTDRTLGSEQGDAIRNFTGVFYSDSFHNSEGVFSSQSYTQFNHPSGGVSFNYAKTNFDPSTAVPTANENRPKNIALIYCIKVFGMVTNEGEVDLQQLTASVAELTNTLQQPAGSVLAFAGATPPAGYLICNGHAVGRETYPDLFVAIGTTYGTGDGSTTFNLPDFRGEFLRGVDLGRGIDAGRTLGSSQGDAIRDIVGNTTRIPNYYTNAGGAFTATQTGTNGFQGNSSNQAAVLEFKASNVVPTANENRPRNVANPLLHQSFWQQNKCSPS